MYVAVISREQGVVLLPRDVSGVLYKGIILLQAWPQNPWGKRVKSVNAQYLEDEDVLWFGRFLVRSGGRQDLVWILLSSPPLATPSHLSWTQFSGAEELGERPCGYVAIPGTFGVCDSLHVTWQLEVKGKYWANEKSEKETSFHRPSENKNQSPLLGLLSPHYLGKENTNLCRGSNLSVSPDLPFKKLLNT